MSCIDEDRKQMENVKMMEKNCHVCFWQIEKFAFSREALFLDIIFMYVTINESEMVSLKIYFTQYSKFACRMHSAAHFPLVTLKSVITLKMLRWTSATYIWWVKAILGSGIRIIRTNEKGLRIRPLEPFLGPSHCLRFVLVDENNIAAEVCAKLRKHWKPLDYE